MRPWTARLWDAAVVAAITAAAAAAVAALTLTVARWPITGAALAAFAAGVALGWWVTWHHYVGRRTGLRLRSLLDHRQRERDRRRREAADALTDVRMLGHATGPIRPGLSPRRGLP